MIFGTHDFDVVAGKVQSIAYREGIIVTDNYAVNPTLEIDNSQVDLSRVGDYDLIYRATDDVGNVTEVTVKVHVVITGRGSESSAEIRAYEEKARKMAADINKKILKSSDTDVVKAMKIFYWVHNNIRFVLHTPQYSNWAVAAINTFTKRYSSCYEILSDTGKQHGPKVIALYDYAIKQGADFIFQTDSDGQTLPEEFDAFWQMRHGYKGIFGHRAVRGDGKSRAFVEKVVCFLLKCYFKVKVPDANAPFRLMDAKTVAK